MLEGNNLLRRDVQRLINAFKRERGAGNYGNLYSRVENESIEGLFSLGVRSLTQIKKAIRFSLYHPRAGVWNDCHLDECRKQDIEAEQRQFLSRVCRARRQCAECELIREHPSPDYQALSDAFRDAVNQKKQWEASEVLVKVPFAYPDKKKGLVHDLIVEVYKGEPHGNVIRFPLSDPDQRDQLENAIDMAKWTAFDYYNQHCDNGGRLEPDRYGLWIHINDYPDDPDDSYPDDPQKQGFSGTSFTLGVAIGILAYLLQEKGVDETIAVSGNIDYSDGQGRVQPVNETLLKAKASRLSGMKKLLICTGSFNDEIDAREGIIQAQRIQLHGKPDKRPDNTEVIPVESLEAALEQVFPKHQADPKKIGEIKRILRWALVIGLFLLVSGMLWLLLDEPDLKSFDVNPTVIDVTPEGNETVEFEVTAAFDSKRWLSTWLKIRSEVPGLPYYINIERIKKGEPVKLGKLVIDSKNFQKEVNYEVPRGNSITFELKYGGQRMNAKTYSSLPQKGGN